MLVALIAAGSIAAATGGQALAFDCTVANKPVGAGSAATVNITTGAETASKPNPGTDQQIHSGFITVTDGSFSADVFAHAPTKAQAPFAEPGVNPGATQQELQGEGCDGKGLDTLDACFGG